MNISPRFGSLVLASVLITTGSLSVVHAETVSVTIRENDTLSMIVQGAYPGYRDRNAIMQWILQRNPQAFRNNDINSLIIGRVLVLPGAEELAGLELSPERNQPATAATQATQSVQTGPEAAQRLQRIVGERDELKKQLQQLESDNQSLRDTIARLEQVKGEQDEQLKQLEQQLETLRSEAVQQEAGQTAPDSENTEALVQAKKQLEQLQARFDAAMADKQTLQNQLAELQKQQAAVDTDSGAASAKTEVMQQEITRLKADIAQLETEKTALQEQIVNLEGSQKTLQSEKEALEKGNGQLKQQLSELERANQTQTTASAELQEQIKTLQQDSDILRADNEQLMADLQVAKDQLVISDADMETLRADLDVLDKKNIALQSEIDQIKAAAAKDVELTPAEPPEQSATSLWPWLLMLFLLPVAWFLGLRSRPAVNLQEATAVETDADKVISDPVMPAPLTHDEIDSGEFSSSVAIIPDDPDVAIKLDMARAYLDLRNAEAANDVLQEVIREGGSRQKQEAKEILSFIS